MDDPTRTVQSIMIDIMVARDAHMNRFNELADEIGASIARGRPRSADQRLQHTSDVTDAHGQMLSSLASSVTDLAGLLAQMAHRLGMEDLVIGPPADDA